MTLRTRAHEAASGRLISSERRAFGLYEPLHVFVRVDDDSSLVVDVLGMAAGVTQIASPMTVSWSDPYGMLRLAMSLDLPSSAIVSSFSFGHRRDHSHPLRKFGKASAKAARAANHEQPAVELSLRASDLVPWIETQLEERFADAETFAGVLDDESVRPIHYEVFIVTSPNAGDSPPGVRIASWAIAQSDRTKVHYELLDQPLQGWGFVELIDAFPDAADLRPGGGPVEHVIADITGYANADISIRDFLREPGLS